MADFVHLCFLLTLRSLFRVRLLYLLLFVVKKTYHDGLDHLVLEVAVVVWTDVQGWFAARGRYVVVMVDFDVQSCFVVRGRYGVDQSSEQLSVKMVIVASERGNLLHEVNLLSAHLPFCV